MSVARKTITIRGVNKELYDQFRKLATFYGANIGHVFSKIIANYEMKRPLFIPHMRSRHAKQMKKFEIIENIDELTINKSDLIEAGELKYLFRNIRKLTFDSSVDNDTLLKYVYKIVNSNVITEGNISQLFLLSTLEDSPQIENNERKDVTIRNVDQDIYEEFVAKCQRDNKTIGDMVNSILARAVIEFEISHILAFELKVLPLETIVISSKDNVVVANKDLNEISSRKVLFHRINKLIFNNVSTENFINKVIGIYNCKNVSLPNNIPKLIRLSRVKNYP